MAQAASASSERAEADVSAAGKPAALQCLAPGVQQELPHPCGGAMAQQVASAMAPPMPAPPLLRPPAARPGPTTRSQGRGMPKAADLQQRTLGTHPAVAHMHQQQAQGHRTSQQQGGRPVMPSIPGWPTTGPAPKSRLGPRLQHSEPAKQHVTTAFCHKRRHVEAFGC